MSHQYFKEKSDGGYRLKLNLKKLNEKVEYKKFAMETIGTILQLVKQGVFMSKLDIKDAYYSISRYEHDQKYLKFQFDRFLYKYTVSPNDYTEGPRKFTKLLKPPLSLSELRRVEKNVIESYFDDLLTIDFSYASCLRNVAKLSNYLLFWDL